MNPKPLSETNFLIVPCGMSATPHNKNLFRDRQRLSRRPPRHTSALAPIFGISGKTAFGTESRDSFHRSILKTNP
jgi:hypothetical protein